MTPYHLSPITMTPTKRRLKPTPQPNEQSKLLLSGVTSALNVRRLKPTPRPVRTGETETAAPRITAEDSAKIATEFYEEVQTEVDNGGGTWFACLRHVLAQWINRAELGANL